MRFITTQTRQLNKKKINNKNKIFNIFKLRVRLLESPELYVNRILPKRPLQLASRKKKKIF